MKIFIEKTQEIYIMTKGTWLQMRCQVRTIAASFCICEYMILLKISLAINGKMRVLFSECIKEFQVMNMAHVLPVNSICKFCLLGLTCSALWTEKYVLDQMFGSSCWLTAFDDTDGLKTYAKYFDYAWSGSDGRNYYLTYISTIVRCSSAY